MIYLVISVSRQDLFIFLFGVGVGWGGGEYQDERCTFLILIITEIRI